MLMGPTAMPVQPHPRVPENVLSFQSLFLSLLLVWCRVASGDPEIVETPLMVYGEGHTAGVNSAVFSPDGSTVLTGSSDHTARLWDMATGAHIRTFTGHADDVDSVAFSPDGTMVLTGSLDRTARLWDTATGAHIRTFTGHSQRVYTIAFSPDGGTVLTGSWDTTARLWDVATGAHIRTFIGHTDSIYPVAFSPDGANILTGSLDRTARLWDTATGAHIRTLTGHTSVVRSLVFSPDGTTILTGSYDTTTRLWNANTGDQIRTYIGPSSAVFCASFSPDGATVLAGFEDDTAWTWDTATAVHLRTFIGHTRFVNSAAYSPDGTTILTGSADWTARLWPSGALSANPANVAVVDVAAPLAAEPGDSIDIDWTLANDGNTSGHGFVQSSLFLRGDGVANAGVERSLISRYDYSDLLPGASAEFSVQASIPPVKEGAWRVRVAANPVTFSDPDLSNNAAESQDQLTIVIPEIAIGNPYAQTLVPSRTWRLARFLQPPGEDAIIRLLSPSGRPLNLHVAYDEIPDPVYHPPATALDSNGALVAYLPADPDGRTAYLRVSSVAPPIGGAPFELSAEPGVLSLLSLGVSEGTNSDNPVIIPFRGTQLGVGIEFFLEPEAGGAEIPAGTVHVIDASQAYAQISMKGNPSGRYDAILRRGPTESRLPGSFTLHAGGIGPVLSARLELPDDGRAGRTLPAWIEYANVGDAPMMVPRFLLIAEGALLSNKPDLEEFIDNSLLPMGISSTAPAGWLKPGEHNRIPFYVFVQPNAPEVRVELSHGSLEGASPTHLQLANALTRLNLKGYPEPIHEYTEALAFATAHAAGEPVASITGRVRHAGNGTPLANTTLMAVVTESGTDEEMLRTFTTDAQGRFSIERLPAEADVRIKEFGTSPRISNPPILLVREDKDLSDVFVGGLTALQVNGRIIDRETGAPIVGAQLLLIGDGDSEASTSQDGGVFSLRAFGQGSRELVIRHPNHAEYRATVELALHDVSLAPITLDRGGELFVSITDEEDIQIEGAVVSIIGESGVAWSERAVTDPTGMAAFDNLSVDEEIGVQVRHQDFRTAMLRPSAAELLTGELRVTLVRGTRIQGRVLGMLPERTYFIHARSATGSHEAVTLSDEVGEYELNGLISGEEYDLMVSSEGETVAAAKGIECNNVSDCKVDLTVMHSDHPESIVVTGTILDATSQLPINGAVVVLNNQDDAAIFVGISDELGEVRFKVWPGTYAARGGHENYLCESTTFPAETTEDFILFLPPAPKAVGQELTLPDGSPTRHDSLPIRTTRAHVSRRTVPNPPAPPSEAQACPPNQNIYSSLQLLHRQLLLLDNDIRLARERHFGAVNAMEKMHDELKDRSMELGMTLFKAAAEDLVEIPGGTAVTAGAFRRTLPHLVNFLGTGHTVHEHIDDWKKWTQKEGATPPVDLLFDGVVDGYGEYYKYLTVFNPDYNIISRQLTALDIFTDFALAGGQSILFWASAGIEYIAYEHLDSLLQEERRIHDEYANLLAAGYQPCTQETPLNDDSITILRAADPNEKAGPEGLGHPKTERWVLPGEKLNYTIYFENMPTATAPAQEIRIHDTLSPHLDWSTFELGVISLGEQTVTDLQGLTTGELELAQLNSALNVRIATDLDLQTGAASWYLRSVDPYSFDGWPSSALEGILPPNDKTGRGQGFITFSVRTYPDLATGTRVENTSQIVFDLEEPIATNTVFNTILADPPGLPSNPSPPDQAFMLPPLQLMFRWNPPLLAESYDLFLWPEGLPEPALPTLRDLSSPLAIVGDLAVGNYSWRVAAHNVIGTTIGPLWSFSITTKLDDQEGMMLR